MTQVPPPPSLDTILQDCFHGFPKDRLLEQEDAKTVRQTLWDAMISEQRYSLLDYLMVWCEFTREKGEPRFQFTSPDSFVLDVCRYFGLPHNSVVKITRDEMRRLSMDGLRHGLQEHVAFMNAWEQINQGRATPQAARAGSGNTATVHRKTRKLPSTTKPPRKLPNQIGDLVEACWISQPKAAKPPPPVARRRVEASTRPGDKSANDAASEETASSSSSSSVIRGTKRTVRPKVCFDPTDLGRSWSEYGREAKKPRHQLMAKAHKPRKPRPSVLLLDPTKLGTQPGVFEPNSLWKYVRREDGETYIVEVTKGRVSKQGKIEVQWKGYRPTPQRVFAADLQCASQQDLDTFRSKYIAARAKAQEERSRRWKTDRPKSEGWS